MKNILLVLVLGSATTSWASGDLIKAKIVRFPSGDLTLGGELYLPEGDGPFPVVLYNHGSASGMKNSVASYLLPVDTDTSLIWGPMALNNVVTGNFFFRSIYAYITLLISVAISPLPLISPKINK